AKGEVIKMNKTARSILGIKEKVRERPDSTIEAGEVMRLRAENGEILPPEQWPVNRVLRGEVMTGANTMDIMMKTLDGREILANVNGTSFYESDETLGGVVVVFRDVTQRRQLEKRAHESLDTVLKMAEALVQAPEDLSVEIKHTPLMAYTVVRRLADLTRSVMGNRSVGIVSIDPETQKLRPIAVVGISAEQERQWLEKLNELSLHDKLSGPQLLERLRANEVLLVDSTDSPPELIASDKGQNELQLAILAPMYTDTQLIGIMALDYNEEPRTRYTSEDLSIAKAVAKLAALVIERERLLTEREESRAHMLALRETNQSMDKFISIASHELKTPITTMKGYVQLLGRKIKTNLNNESSSENEQKSELLKMVSRMETQIDRLIRLEDDLLDVSRIKADQLDLHLENFNLADLVTKVIDDHNLMYADREIQLENHTSETIQIQADAERIEQVVTNYLSNALKYAPPTKPITVHLHTNENQAYVSVKDEGPGLPPEEHKRIWDNFYRVKDVDIQSGSGVGLGIGLHICRSIVEQHKGKYGISSTPGQGSTFWFSIPLSDEGATELSEKQHSL
ncbi:MAG TPA: ATP-binding protein, partial [Ktedonobacteraceae bacterium]|nr:ATP-binding protein [Ktedonobacteraceae bacterium]